MEAGRMTDANHGIIDTIRMLRSKGVPTDRCASCGAKEMRLNPLHYECGSHWIRTTRGASLASTPRCIEVSIGHRFGAPLVAYCVENDLTKHAFELAVHRGGKDLGRWRIVVERIEEPNDDERLAEHGHEPGTAN